MRLPKRLRRKERVEGACPHAAHRPQHRENWVDDPIFRYPIWLRLTGAIWLMMVAAFGSMIVWETRANRDMAIEQAKDFAGTVNEMTMAGARPG